MNVTLILIMGGLLLGCAAAGVIGLYMLRSRPNRKARNRLVILLGQVVVAVSVLTSLVILQKLEQFFSVVRHSSAYYSAMYAYVLGLLFGVFFVLRAEFRWRQASGLVTATKNNGPVVPGARRRFLIAFGIVAISAGFSVAFWVNRPKPISVIFGGASMLFAFAPIIFLGRTLGRAQMKESRNVILVISSAMLCMFGGLAWKLREAEPALSSAWLVTLAVPCVAALLALVFLRSSTDSARLTRKPDK
jgi:xanthine/uracil permease